MNRPSPSASQREVLREALLSTLDMLHHRRAADIPDGYIDDYIQLNWLEWDGGWLRVTDVGDNVRRQLVQRTRIAP